MMLILMVGLATTGSSAYAQESDAQRFIRLTKQMEENPAPIDDENRKWMAQLMADSEDVQLVLDFSLLMKLFALEMPKGPFKSKADFQRQNPMRLPGRPELTAQYVYGQAAYQLQNPDRISHVLEAQLAGLRSLLTLYPSMLKQYPDARIDHIDELLAEEVIHQLDAELKRLVMGSLTFDSNAVPEKFLGEWAANPESCGDKASAASIKIWERGVRFTENVDRMYHWNYTGGPGLAIARYYKTDERWGYNTFEYLQLSEDQTFLTLESDRDVPGVYYRCAPEQKEPPTSLAEARQLAAQSMSAEGAREWGANEDYLRWFESLTGAAFRMCDGALLDGQDQSFTMYFRLADTGQVKESLLDGKTAYSACFYSRVTKLAINFPVPIKDDFWLKVEMDMGSGDE
jgi:hypothetical protein